MENIHNVDVATNKFKVLFADVRYDILTDLRKTRKQNSWGCLHEIPELSDETSAETQIRAIVFGEKEMGGKTLTLEEFDKLLTEQGIDTKGRDAALLRMTQPN